MPLNLGTPFEANENSNALQSAPAIVGLAGASAALFWQSKEAQTGSYKIVGRIFDSSGFPKASETQIGQGSGRWVAACKLNNGAIAVAWMSRSFSIRLRVLSADLSSGSAEVNVNSNQGIHFHPELTSLRNGNFAVVWSDHLTPGPPVVRARVFSKLGSPIADSVAVDNSEDRRKSHCSIANIWKSRSLIVWRDTFVRNQAHTDWSTNIKAQVVNRNLEDRSTVFDVARDLDFHPNEELLGGLKGLTSTVRLAEGRGLVAYAMTDGVTAEIVAYNGSNITVAKRVQVVKNLPHVSSVSASANSKGEIIIGWASNSGVEGRILNDKGELLSDVFGISAPSPKSYRCDTTLAGENFLVTWEDISSVFRVKGRSVSWSS